MEGPVIKNVRDFKFPVDGGEEAMDKMLSGTAKMTSAFKEKNETTQYTCKKPEPGPLGGLNTNS